MLIASPDTPTIARYDLRNLYAVERCISREKMMYYYQLGKQGLLNYCQENPILTEYTIFSRHPGRIRLEIIDGCHRAKAFFHHRIYLIDVEVNNSPTDPAKDEITPWKLTSLRELNSREFRRYLKSMGE